MHNLSSFADEHSERPIPPKVEAAMARLRVAKVVYFEGFASEAQQMAEIRRHLPALLAGALTALRGHPALAVGAEGLEDQVLQSTEALPGYDDDDMCSIAYELLTVLYDAFRGRFVNDLLVFIKDMLVPWSAPLPRDAAAAPTEAAAVAVAAMGQPSMPTTAATLPVAGERLDEGPHWTEVDAATLALGLICNYTWPNSEISRLLDIVSRNLTASMSVQPRLAATCALTLSKFSVLLTSVPRLHPLYSHLTACIWIMLRDASPTSVPHSHVYIRRVLLALRLTWVHVLDLELPDLLLPMVPNLLDAICGNLATWCVECACEPGGGHPKGIVPLSTRLRLLASRIFLFLLVVVFSLLRIG